jgi:hypothetical protein
MLSPLVQIQRVSTEGSSNRLFCFLRDSQAMRYVGGSLLKTLLHEQARAGTVGEFLEPGG